VKAIIFKYSKVEYGVIFYVTKVTTAVRTTVIRL